MYLGVAHKDHEVAHWFNMGNSQLFVNIIFKRDNMLKIIIRLSVYYSEFIRE